MSGVELRAFLAGRRAGASESLAWFGGRLRLRLESYLSSELPPLYCVVSARAVVLRDDRVLVVRDPDTTHVTPGGRRQPGESLEQTLRREVIEETGWGLGAIALLGFAHFHHLTPRPRDYRYPYPDFVHAVYAAQAGDFDAAARQSDGYELEARFRPVPEARALFVRPAPTASTGQALYLDAALAALGPR